MKQQSIITEIRWALQKQSDVAVAKASGRFYKSGEAAQVYGVRMDVVNKLGKDFYKQIKNWEKLDIFEVCEELWKSKHLEEAVIACVFTESLEKKYEETDFKIFEHWIKNYVNNWADCDTFCNHTMGSFVMKFPTYVNELKRWSCLDSDVKINSTSERWVKRAAAVSLIIPARRGMFLNDIFEIAEELLLDKDDLVQKGYGWMLKAASMTEKSAKGSQRTKAEHLVAVFDFIMKHKAVMPRTALRYAIEKMPPELRMEALAK